MDDYKIALGALLDANAKGDINKQLNAIKDLSVTISKATLSNDVINDIKRQLTQNGIDLKLVFGNVGQITSQAKQTWQQIGQQINQGISQSINNSTGLLNTFKLSLQNIGMGSKEIDAVANRIQNLGVQIESLNQSKSHSIGKNGKDILSVDISGTDSLGQAIKLTEQYNIATGELIRSIDAVSTAQQKSSANTSSFVKQQSQAVSNLTNQINQLNRSAIDQNASRPISDATHLNNLSTAYNDIISAINKMGNASSNAFTTEKNNVKTLISDFKSLVSEYRNAENVSIKMKGTDITSGIAIATNDFEKFKAEAKDFPQITQTINNLNTAISNVADASSLNSFNDQLRIARSELSKIKSETSTLNKEEKVGINISNLKAQISDLQRISPVINTFEADVNGAKTTIQSLLDDLTRVNTQSDFSVVNSKWKAFTNSAKSAGIAITETISKADNLSDIVKNITQSYENGTYDAKVESIIAKTRQWVDEQDNARISTVTLQSSLEKLSKAYIDLNSSGGYTVENQKKLKQAESELSEEIKKVTNEITKMNAEYAKSSKVESFNQKLTEFYDKNTAARRRWGAELEQMMNATTSGAKVTNSELINMEHRFTQIGNEARQAGKLGLYFFDSIKEQAKKFTQWVSVTSVVMEGVQAVKQLISVSKELDAVMTDFTMATGTTGSQLEALTESYSKLADKLKSTTTDVMTSATEWIKQGQSIADTETLVSNSMILSKIGKLDSADATKYLTSAMKGYKVSVEDTLSVVDKLSAVDMASATDVGGLAEGMSEVAASADLAGVSMDKLLGYLAAIGETTQSGMSEVGTTLNAVFSRMGNIKLSRLKDYQNNGDDLSNVETVLRGVGITLRDSVNSFRDFDEVLDETASNWKNYSEVQQRAIASAFAGTHHVNEFIVLMENYDKALEYTEKSLNSSGEAMDKFSAYEKSVEAHTESFTNAIQSLSNTAVDSGLVNFFIDLGTTGVKVIDGLVSALTPLGALAAGGSLFAGIKNVGIFKELPTIISDLNKLGIALKSLDSMNIGSSGVNIANIESYRTALKGLTTEQSVFALASKGATDEQIRQILATNQATASEVEAALAKAGLTTATKALTQAEMVEIATKNGVAKSEAEALLSKIGITSTEKSQVVVKKQVTLAMLEQAVASGTLTKAEASQIATMLGLNAAETTNIGITNILTASFTKLWAVITAHPIGAILTAIGAVAVGTIAYINKVDKDAEKALEKAHEDAENALEESKSSLSDNKSELQSINSELDQVKNRIKEISSIGSPTLTEQNELDKLSMANNQLEIQKNLLENNIKLKQKSASLDAKELLGTQTELKDFTLSSDGTISENTEKYDYKKAAELNAYNLKEAYNIYLKAIEEGNISAQEEAQSLIDSVAGESSSFTSELLNIIESFKYDDGTIIEGYEDIYNEYMGMIYNIQSLTNPDMFLNIAKNITSGTNIDYEKAISEAYALAYDGNFNLDSLNQDFVKALADAGIDESTINYIFSLKQKEYQLLVDKINSKYDSSKVQFTYWDGKGDIYHDYDKEESTKKDLEKINRELNDYAKNNPIEFQLISSFDGNFDLLDTYIEEEKEKAKSSTDYVGDYVTNAINHIYDEAKSKDLVTEVIGNETDISWALSEENSKAIDDFQGKIKDLKGALESLKTGDMENNDLVDIMQTFPELQNASGDLETTIKSLIDTLLNNLLNLLGSDAPTQLVDSISAIANIADDVDLSPIEKSIAGMSKVSETLKPLNSVFEDFKENTYLSQESIESLQKSFGKLDSFDAFISVVTKAGLTEQELDSALDKIVTDYLDQTDALDSLNVGTAEYVANVLSEVGVSNSLEVVLSRLGLTIDEYARLKSYANEKGIDLCNITSSEVVSILNEINVTEDAITSFANLALAKENTNLATIDTTGDIENLSNLVEACGGATKALSALMSAKLLMDEANAGDSSAISHLQMLASQSGKTIEEWYAEQQRSAQKEIDDALKKGSSRNATVQFVPPNYQYVPENTKKEKQAKETEIDYAKNTIEDLKDSYEDLARVTSNLEKNGDLTDYYAKHTKAIQDENDALNALIGTESKVRENGKRIKGTGLTGAKESYEKEYEKALKATGNSDKYRKLIENGSLDVKTYKGELGENLKTALDAYGKIRDTENEIASYEDKIAENNRKIKEDAREQADYKLKEKEYEEEIATSNKEKNNAIDGQIKQLKVLRNLEIADAKSPEEVSQINNEYDNKINSLKDKKASNSEDTYKLKQEGLEIDKEEAKSLEERNKIIEKEKANRKKIYQQAVKQASTDEDKIRLEREYYADIKKYDDEIHQNNVNRIQLDQDELENQKELAQNYDKRNKLIDKQKSKRTELYAIQVAEAKTVEETEELTRAYNNEMSAYDDEQKKNIQDKLQMQYDSLEAQKDETATVAEKNRIIEQEKFLRERIYLQAIAQAKTEEERNKLQKEYLADIKTLDKEAADNITNAKNSYIDLQETIAGLLDNDVELRIAMGENITEADYGNLINQQLHIKQLYQQQYDEQLKILDTLEPTSEEWDKTVDIMSNALAKINACDTAILKYNKAMKETPVENIKKGVDALTRLKDEVSDMIGLLDDNSKSGITAMTLYQKKLSIIEAQIQQNNQAMALLNKNSEEFQELQAENRNLASEQLSIYEELSKIRIDSINEETERMKELVDLKKKENEEEYNKQKLTKQIAKDNESLAKMEAKLQQLRMNNSDGANNKLILELESRLAKKKDELSEDQLEREYEAKQDALDKEYELKEKANQKEIESIENSNDKKEQIAKEMLAGVAYTYEGYFQEVNSMADSYGIKLTDSIKSQWKDRQSAVEEYIAIAKQAISIDTTQSTNDYNIGNNGQRDKNIDSFTIGTSKANDIKTNPIKKANPVKEQILYILKHGEGATAKSKLNKYIISKKEYGGKPISYKQMSTVYNLLTGENTTSKDFKSNIPMIDKLFTQLKEAGFYNGGIIEKAGNIIKSNGDNVLMTARTGESVLTEEQTKALLSLRNYIPTFATVAKNLPLNNVQRKSDINVTIPMQFHDCVTNDEMLKQMKGMVYQEANGAINEVLRKM